MPWHTARGLGDYGERMAARYLSEHGLHVLDRNWRCELGEIDLVLRDGPVLVVCEVKTRSSRESALSKPCKKTSPGTLTR